MYEHVLPAVNGPVFHAGVVCCSSFVVVATAISECHVPFVLAISIGLSGWLGSVSCPRSSDARPFGNNDRSEFCKCRVFSLIVERSASTAGLTLDKP